jgi:hypothetical protein
MAATNGLKQNADGKAVSRLLGTALPFDGLGVVYSEVFFALRELFPKFGMTHVGVNPHIDPAIGWLLSHQRRPSSASPDHNMP